jgi:hypothetical protein
VVPIDRNGGVKPTGLFKDYAEYFYDMLSEAGVDAGDGLSDTEFKLLIHRQYNKVKSVANEGFC